MLSTDRNSKSVSCDSLFYERSSPKRKLLSRTPSVMNGGSNISFKNDDYNYLINCNELIKTCKEALLENETNILNNITELNYSNGFNDSSQKENFNSVQQPAEHHKSSLAEFVKWLAYTEHQLETICYCANTKISSDWADIISHHKALQSEIENVGRRFINDIKDNNAIQCNYGSVGATTTTTKLTKTLTKEERRWHSLWLRSLEYLMILEEGHYCPQHYSVSVDEQLPSKRHKNNVGVVTNSDRIRNKRVQTTVAMVGQTKSELFRRDNCNEKLEIIQKDIGYSSDADMSDTVEVHPHSDQATLSSRSTRKLRRRRKSRLTRTRPWSFHSDWTDWDYYQTPLHGAYVSSEDLYYEDDKTIRQLIEFGENYETWITNDDIDLNDDLIIASTPSSLIKDEPQTEQPEPTPVVEVVSRPAKTRAKRSVTTMTLTVLLYASVAILALALTLTNYSPHIQKLYRRPPPI